MLDCDGQQMQVGSLIKFINTTSNPNRRVTTNNVYVVIRVPEDDGEAIILDNENGEFSISRSSNWEIQGHIKTTRHI
jgi:hypothetical protein